MTECQGCGAWNDTSRTLCVLCGTPLAETDEWDAATELPPLPPLPDGGLRVSMPTWLRDAPTATPSFPLSPPSPPFPPSSEASPLGPRADPRTFLSDDDFPRWLRDLAARRDEAAPPASHIVAPPPHPAAAAVELVPPGGWPSWSGLAASSPPAAPDSDAAFVAPVIAGSASADATTEAPAVPPTLAPAPDGRSAATVVAARAFEERRGREPWETLLLVLLFIGVVVAALWALVANGVFSPGL